MKYIITIPYIFKIAIPYCSSEKYCYVSVLSFYRYVVQLELVLHELSFGSVLYACQL